ncbi:DNA primase [Oceanotoga phage vB_OteS-UFV02]
MNFKQTKMFFEILYSSVSRGYLQLQIIKPDNSYFKYFPFPLNMQDLEDFIDKEKGKGHIYFGVNPRSNNTSTGTNNDVQEIVAFWVDLDSKDFGNNMELTRAQLDNFPLKPSIIVNSGHGYHAYWVLHEPVEITKENFEDITKLSAGVHHKVSADATHDLRRILRVPSTPNIKDPNNPKLITGDSTKWVYCKIEDMSFNSYSIDDIKTAVPNYESLDISQTTYELNLNDVVSFDTFENFVKILENKAGQEKAQDLVKLIQTRTEEEDRSTNDFKLIAQLYHLKFNDSEIVKLFNLALSLKYPIADKFKERGIAYLTMTMKKAKMESNALLKLFIELEQTSDEFKTKKLPDVYKQILKLTPIEQSAKLQELKKILGKGYTQSAVNKDFSAYRAKVQAQDKSFYEVTMEGKVKFNLNKFIENLLEKHYIVYYLDEFYIYEDGVYKNNGAEMYLKRLIASMLEDDWSTSMENEIIEKLKLETFKDPKDIAMPELYLNFKNGMLNLKTKKIEKHSPAFYSFIQFNAKYNKNAKPDEIDKFISGVFAEESIPIIWEFLGYVMYPNIEMKKLLILLGDGHNGKSKFIELVEKVIGEDYVSHESLQHLTNDKFSTGQLFNRVLNTYADLPAKALEETEQIKMLTGGDTIRGEEKFKKAHYFKNTARFIFSCNTLPPVTHHDPQFFDRLMIIRTPYRYEGNQANRNILEEISTEENFSAFVNRCLEGLERLLSQNEFTYSFESARELKEYQLLHNSVMDYMDKAVDTKEGGYVEKRELYSEYRKFCSYAGRHPVSRRKFNDILMGTPFILEEFRPRVDGKQIYAWKDIVITNKFGGTQINIRE